MTPATKKALGCVDWGQVVANGGPPCFHVESGRFCLRAERWGGHNLPEAKADIGHSFVSLDTFCEAESNLATDELAKEAPTPAHMEALYELYEQMSCAGPIDSFTVKEILVRIQATDTRPPVDIEKIAKAVKKLREAK